MNAEELLKTMFRSFFIITAGIVISMYVFCLIFYPDASFTLYDIGGILLLAVISDLPYLLFYSGKELSKKQMYLRKSVHLPVLLAVVLYFAHLWDWVNLNSTKEVLVLLLLILIVYAIVFAITIYYDKKLADKLTHRLRERYRSQ
ncbi:DUF3021 family protein [Anaerobacterium chartisolvens]|uniref:DUF3021 family protein n=1 Tax=Anaerobacterium chartisolvens TaxID=1297424 RepID=A0A369B4I7_9FIRM|nr:DUF3021 family protein [Anaerobacterium chartisolvens]RCX16371.1 DUF3021 family protein [Anaerobacterium chartisolvens]